MKKLYSKQLGSEVYALAPEQLKVFASRESARMRYSNSRRALLSFVRPPKR